MQRGIFIFILAFGISFLLYHITSGQPKWVTYHGDFASFKIRWDYEMDYKNEGSFFTYIIKDPKYPDCRLVITKGHNQIKYNLSGKDGYETKISGPIKAVNTQGYERSGINSRNLNWMEAYLYISVKGVYGPDTRLIYAAYDNAPDNLSADFKEIITSIEVKDPINVEITPRSAP